MTRLAEPGRRVRIHIKAALFIGLAFLTACRNPNAPEGPSVQIVVEIKYVRIAPVTYSVAFELVQLSSQAVTPDSGLPDARIQDMTKVEESMFTLSIAVWTNYDTTIWVMDSWLYQAGDKFSFQYVAKDLFVNGQRMSKITAKGTTPWCGTVKFIVKNDGLIVQP